MATRKNDRDSSFLNAFTVGEFIKNDDGSNKTYLLFGEEEFYIEKAEIALRRKYLAEGAESMDYVKLDPSSKDFSTDKIRENAELPPWLSSKRIVLVKGDSLFDKLDSDKFPGLVKAVPESTLLIFSTDKIDKRKKSLMTAFKENGPVAQIDTLSEDNLIMAVVKKLRNNNIGISSVTAGSIVSRCDNSMRRIMTESDKLILYASAEGLSEISDDLVERMCPPDIKGSVFNITDKIGAGDASGALKILDNLIIMKEPPIKIRFMLGRHIKQLICAKDMGNKNELASKLGIHPYGAEKLISQSRNFTVAALSDLYIRCAKDDLEVKSGLLDDRMSLESLIARACGRFC